VPDIDFNEYFAVGVSMGERNSGGYSTTITELTLQDKTLHVTAHETIPGRDAPGGLTLALTQPYHILILPRRINADDSFDTGDGYRVKFSIQ
jgi:hypothetical protein